MPIQLLSWLCLSHSEKGPERNSIAGALKVLASVPGAKGLSVASAWLGELVISLSRNVKTYSSIRVVGLTPIC